MGRIEKTTARFVVALGLVAGLFWLSHRNTDRVIESQAWVLRTHAVIGELRALQTHVTEAESAGRGFVITGDARFLPPYEQALATTPKHAAVLRSLLAEDAGQLKRLDTLLALVQAKLDAVAERIALRREQGFDAAASAVRSMKGQDLMDEIRRITGEMESEAQRLLTARTAAVISDTTQVNITLFLGAVACIGLLLLVFMARNRELGRRRAAEERLKASSAYARSLMEAQTLVNVEEIGRRKDGRMIRILENVSLIETSSGQPGIIEGTLIDITERKTLEEQFHQAQKMEAIGRLAGGVAHDFNNILTAILGYSSLVQAQLGQEHPLWQDVEEIRKAGDRAAGLTRQLLVFSRRQVLMPEIVDLNALVTNIEKMLQRVIGEDIAVHTRIDPSLGRVEADPGRIEQAIMNLCVNARDAMPRGGGAHGRDAQHRPRRIVRTRPCGGPSRPLCHARRQRHRSGD